MAGSNVGAPTRWAHIEVSRLASIRCQTIQSPNVAGACSFDIEEATLTDVPNWRSYPMMLLLTPSNSSQTMYREPTSTLLAGLAPLSVTESTVGQVRSTHSTRVAPAAPWIQAIVVPSMRASRTTSGAAMRSCVVPSMMLYSRTTPVELSPGTDAV